jgi:Aldo/keto reductases, related to diketogulonate reductase
MSHTNRFSVVDDPTVQGIAKKLGKDPAQLLISWAIQRGTAVLPKSVTASRIQSNFQGKIHPVNTISIQLSGKLMYLTI